MSAFFVVTATIKDPDKYHAYAQGVGPTLAAHGGKALKRGKAVRALAGELAHQSIVIVEFPELAALEAWHASEEYQALIPLRSEAADMTITAYEVPA
ncbi:DUF1330 domain-containing protein [Erythrobacter sp.]|uniref:DUF1330 domain-containing protein n=1 Tax=Erythrobacter sp. TaxID=1042 RepID=UPI00311E92B4